MRWLINAIYKKKKFTYKWKYSPKIVLLSYADGMVVMPTDCVLFSSDFAISQGYWEDRFFKKQFFKKNLSSMNLISWNWICLIATS